VESAADAVKSSKVDLQDSAIGHAFFAQSPAD
jgi:hypothetical protein